MNDGVTTRSIDSAINVLPGQAADSAASARRSRGQSDPPAEVPLNVLKILFGARHARSGKTDAMRVLVTDDDARLMELLQQGLRAEGFAVDAASDSLDGLAKAAADTHDVIITDVVMPASTAAKCAPTCSRSATTPRFSC
ncbi:response regulator transcription factor [Streptomyces sp. NPDC058457]|uniref:response regulator transcription factor n=1 Tax=Streptomyces sp. NPDC058457 TaxID=3346507 RepID=UPI003660B3AE